MKGTWEQAAAYAVENNVFYAKEPKAKRLLLEEAAMTYLSTGSLENLTSTQGLYWTMMNLQKLATAPALYHASGTMTARAHAPFVVWCFGTTFTRKTSFALEYADFAKAEAYTSPPMSSEKDCKIWFHGYRNQDIAILDDVRAQSLPLPLFLRLADRTTCMVEVKGSSALFASNMIFVTAPTPPWEFWNQAASEVSQALRRVTVLLEFQKTVEDVADNVGWDGKGAFVQPNETERWTRFIHELHGEQVQFTRKLHWFQRVGDTPQARMFKEFSGYSETSN
jgi:hypothetical protein